MNTAEDFLRENSVDAQRGFLPAQDPARRLPEAYQAWEEIAFEIPKLLGAGRFHAAIESMPELDPADLTTAAEINRAMLLLSYLGQSYVFGGKEPRDCIPSRLARPWHAVASELQRPPVLSYASHALSNWRRFDAEQPIALGNIARLENFLGGIDEDWFVLVHVAIEAAAGPGLLAGVRAQDAADAQDPAEVTSALLTIGETLSAMLAILRRMPENCDPYIYYNRVRQFIFGWMDNPALPDGVRYEGVEAYGGRPQKFRGETGAQSSIIPAFDTVLGVDLSGDRLGEHLMELRDYMPRPHRDFLAGLAKRPSVRDFVLTEVNNGALVAAYNECLRLTAEFRMQHLEYAGTYIRAQQQRTDANPVAVGTGGTPFMKYLAQHARDMDRYRVG